MTSAINFSPVSLTPLNSLSPVSINIHSRISPRIFEKTQNGPNGILGGLGDWFMKKTWSRKSRVRLPLITGVKDTGDKMRKCIIVMLKIIMNRCTVLKLCDGHLTRIFTCVIVTCKILTLYHGHVGFSLYVSWSHAVLYYSHAVSGFHRRSRYSRCVYHHGPI